MGAGFAQDNTLPSHLPTLPSPFRDSPGQFWAISLDLKVLNGHVSHTRCCSPGMWVRADFSEEQLFFLPRLSALGTLTSTTATRSSTLQRKELWWVKGRDLGITARHPSNQVVEAKAVCLECSLGRTVHENLVFQLQPCCVMSQARRPGC